MPPDWAGLTDASDEASFCSAWLASQCALIPNIVAGLLLVPPPAKGVSVTSTSWPERNPYFSDLTRISERAALERRAVFSPSQPGIASGGARSLALLLALPLVSETNPQAIVAVALAAASSRVPTPESIAQQLRWGAGWLEALPWVRRLKTAASDFDRASSCLDVVAAVGEQPRLQGTAVVLTNDLVGRLHCDRVSMGFIGRNGSIRLCAMSHSATLKGQGRLIDAIENAMEEAIDQRSSVAYPMLPSTERVVTMAHRALADTVRAAGASFISALILDGNRNPVGVITFERHRNHSFDQASLRLAEGIAALLGPYIALQLRTNKLVAGRITDYLADGLSALFGPRRPGFKLAAIAISALVLFLCVAKAEHRVTAKAVLVGEVQRAAVAPFDGFIRSAPVRAGFTVKSGDLLAQFEDRDLVLDQLKWRAEREELLQKRHEALAKHDRANLVVLGFQIQQAELQLALAEEKLARTKIAAPFDAIVVSGDLSQMLGSPVDKGKVLFELAPLNAYRLIIHVDERDVRYIAVNQRGIVTFAGMPSEPLPITLNTITPITTVEEGHNSFRVEAKLMQKDPNLRPGMEGVAKIETGRRALLWIWTRTVIDWVRLAAWKYLP